MPLSPPRSLAMAADPHRARTGTLPSPRLAAVSLGGGSWWTMAMSSLASAAPTRISGQHPPPNAPPRPRRSAGKRHKLTPKQAKPPKVGRKKKVEAERTELVELPSLNLCFRVVAAPTFHPDGDTPPPRRLGSSLAPARQHAGRMRGCWEWA